MRVDFIHTPDETIPATERLQVLITPTRRVEVLTELTDLRFNVSRIKWLLAESSDTGASAHAALQRGLNAFLEHDLTDAESEALYRFFGYAHFHTTVGCGFTAAEVADLLAVFLNKTLLDHDLVGAIDRYVAYAHPQAYTAAGDLARLCFLLKLLIPVMGQLTHLEREDPTNLVTRDPPFYRVVRKAVEVLHPEADELIAEVLDEVVAEKSKREPFAQLALRQLIGRSLGAFRLDGGHGDTLRQATAGALRDALAVAYSNFRSTEHHKRRAGILNHPTCILLERRGPGMAYYAHPIGTAVAATFTATMTTAASDAAAIPAVIWTTTPAHATPVSPDIRLHKPTPHCIRLYAADFGDHIETLCDIEMQFSKTQAGGEAKTWTTRQDKYRTFANTDPVERRNAFTAWAAAVLAAPTPVSEKDPSFWTTK